MFIYSHCPKQPQWQLLQPALSLSEFEALPVVTSFFFEVGMQFMRLNSGVLFTERGVVTVTLGFTQPTAFNFRLACGHSGAEEIQVLAHNFWKNNQDTSKVLPA